jgi:hypothetical protein
MDIKSKQEESVNNMNHAHTNNASHQIQRKWHPRKRKCQTSLMASENGSTIEVKGRG